MYGATVGSIVGLLVLGDFVGSTVGVKDGRALYKLVFLLHLKAKPAKLES
jgi:hypothetical protein